MVLTTSPGPRRPLANQPPRATEERLEELPHTRTHVWHSSFLLQDQLQGTPKQPYVPVVLDWALNSIPLYAFRGSLTPLQEVVRRVNPGAPTC